jgi:UDP-N-acetyl-D-galactosamine dehydrogenase
LTLTEAPEDGAYDGVILAVGHDEFRQIGAEGLRRFGKPEHVLYDLKHLLDATESELRL